MSRICQGLRWLMFSGLNDMRCARIVQPPFACLSGESSAAGRKPGDEIGISRSSP
jgi:hypothetical protein